MEITAKIVKIFPQGKTLKAIACIFFDGCFIVHGVKVIDSEKGLFVTMPNEKRGEQYRDICHPLNSETREYITELVLSAYADFIPIIQTA